jgi:3-oxoacyl-[acyl-carrier protein] reductase
MNTEFQSALSGQVALVTGATRGLGAAIAAALHSQGAKVVGTATSDAGARSIAERGLDGRVLDVTDAAQCESLIDAVSASHGPITVLVNNAGITRDTLAMRMKDDDWSAVMHTNLDAVFRLSRLVLRPMLKARTGRIIQITSVVGAIGNAGQTNYAAAKAGVVGMSKALAREVGSRGITVNCVAPGFIDTDMTQALSEEQRNALLAQIPAARFGKPEDVAAAVAFLAGPNAGYITGQCLHVNGGMAMP